MIQRIQSLYFLMAGIFPALLFFIPSLTFVKGHDLYEMSALTLTDFSGQSIATPVGVVVLTLASIILPIITIFYFKNRKLQIKLGKINFVVLLLLGIVMAVYASSFVGKYSFTDFSLAFGGIFWVLSFFSTYLANRAVQKDEDLVRAADRIR